MPRIVAVRRCRPQMPSLRHTIVFSANRWWAAHPCHSHRALRRTDLSFLAIPMSTSPSSSPAKAAVEPPSGTCRPWRHLTARVFTAPACVEPAMFASSTQTQVMLQLTDWRTSSEFDQSSSRGQKHDLALDVPASGSFMGPPRIRQRERAVDGDAHGARIEQTPQFCELWTV